MSYESTMMGVPRLVPPPWAKQLFVNVLSPEYTSAADASPYSFDLSRAIADASGGILFFPAAVYAINASVMFPSSVAVMFAPGAILNVAAGKIVTVNGQVIAGMDQWIEGAGTVVFGAKVPFLYPQWWGAVADGPNDATTAFAAALASAFLSDNNSVFVPPGDYITDAGAIVIPQGVTLHATESSGEYDGNAYAHGARFRRTAGGVANAPIVQLSTSSQCRGVELRWEKAGGALQGVLRVGVAGTFITNAKFRGAIRGTRTGDINGGTTCYGVLFPDSGDARYFNDIDAYVTECDTSLKMGNNANANRIVIMSREAHCHADLNAAAGQCIENDITLRAFAITVLNPATGLRMRNAVRNRIGGVYEAYGSCYDIDETTAGSNYIDMIVNEAAPSFVPATSLDSGYAQPVNRNQTAQMLLPVRATGDRNIFGRGNRVRLLKDVNGALPWMNRPAGTLAAADNNVKRVVQFGAQYTKAGLISVAGRLRIYAYAPFNLGMNFVDVEFIYRNTSTLGSGQLCITRVVQKGGIITGLYFVKGTTAGRPFSIALVGGGSGSDTPFDAMSVSLEIEALTYSTNVVSMSDLADVTFATAALDASDVADGITMLTVADTAV